MGSVLERVALPSLTGQVLLTQREDQSSCTHSAGGFSWLCSHSFPPGSFRASPTSAHTCPTPAHTCLCLSYPCPHLPTPNPTPAHTCSHLILPLPTSAPTCPTPVHTCSRLSYPCPHLPYTCPHLSTPALPLSTPAHMGFYMQEHWSGLPFPSPGDLPDPGMEPRSPTLQADALTSAPPGKPLNTRILTSKISKGGKEARLKEEGGGGGRGGEKGGLTDICHLQIPRRYGTLPWASREGRNGTWPYQKSDQTRAEPEFEFSAKRR